MKQVLEHHHKACWIMFAWMFAPRQRKREQENKRKSMQKRSAKSIFGVKTIVEHTN